MEILCVADMHGNFMLESLERTIRERKIRKAFILGDFPEYGLKGRTNSDEIRNFLKTLNAYGVNEIYAIPGNCDSESILKIFEEFNADFHNKNAFINSFEFIFLGGSNPTPFSSPMKYSEEEIYFSLKNLFEKNKNKNKKILITHCPPRNTGCDRVRDSTHTGSFGIRKIIEEFNPELNLCSHIHESAGEEDYIKNTKIVNVGPLKLGCCILHLKENGEFGLERVNYN